MDIQCTMEYDVTEHKDMPLSAKLAVTKHNDLPPPGELAIMKNKYIHPSTEWKLVSKLWCFLKINTKYCNIET